MKLYPIETQHFKLDGGAMFGVVPKSLWQKTNPADNNNLIDMAARCLLVENGDRLMLIDTGMGDKQSEKFFGYYSLWGNDDLLKSIRQAGFHPDEVTDVFLTHLHFDHSGGAVAKNAKSDTLYPTFKNATYWSNESHWQWATKPNPREKASFLSENIFPLQESGQLRFVSPDLDSFSTPFEGFPITIFFADGHTEKQMIPLIDYKGKTLAFMADLLPTAGHIPLPYVMGYDTRPLLTLTEKEIFLNKAATEGWYLFLEHDALHHAITVQHTEKGIRLKEILNLTDLL